VKQTILKFESPPQTQKIFFQTPISRTNHIIQKCHFCLLANNNYPYIEGHVCIRKTLYKNFTKEKLLSKCHECCWSATWLHPNYEISPEPIKEESSKMQLKYQRLIVAENFNNVNVCADWVFDCYNINCLECQIKFCFKLQTIQKKLFSQFCF
jgi:hypothetical protein